MTPELPAVCSRLVDAGYQVGVAHGCTHREKHALAEARAAADPERIDVDATYIAQQVGLGAAANGADAAKLVELTARALKMALSSLGQQRDERVLFHERAVEHAANSPTVYNVTGHGVSNLHLAVDDTTGEGAADHDREAAESLLAAAGPKPRRGK